MENKELKAELGGCFGYLLALVTALAFGGLVAMYLWNGIISPTFGMVYLNFWQGLGIDLFVSYLVSTGRSEDKSSSTKELFISAIAKTFVFLIMGWIVIQFI